jgi:hypothetical protein
MTKYNSSFKDNRSTESHMTLMEAFCKLGLFTGTMTQVIKEHEEFPLCPALAYLHTPSGHKLRIWVIDREIVTKAVEHLSPKTQAMLANNKGRDYRDMQYFQKEIKLSFQYAYNLVKTVRMLKKKEINGTAGKKPYTNHFVIVGSRSPELRVETFSYEDEMVEVECHGKCAYDKIKEIIRLHRVKAISYWNPEAK